MRAADGVREAARRTIEFSRQEHEPRADETKLRAVRNLTQENVLLGACLRRTVLFSHISSGGKERGGEQVNSHN